MNFQDQIKIWQGLENFRQVLLELLTHDINKVNQATLDRLFPGYGFMLEVNRKTQLIKALEQEQKTLDPNSDLYQNINKELEQIRDLSEELILRKETEDFKYEIILKNQRTQINLAGFVKIVNQHNPRHRGLLSWQNKSRNPVLFIAELIPAKNYNTASFHINLGTNDGLVLISEKDNGYLWTQSLEYEYSNMMNSEYGSIFIDNDTKTVKLMDNNIAAVTALSKAQTRLDSGKTLFENNIELMLLYKKDLQDLDFG